MIDVAAQMVARVEFGRQTGGRRIKAPQSSGGNYRFWSVTASTASFSQFVSFIRSNFLRYNL